MLVTSMLRYGGYGGAGNRTRVRQQFSADVYVCFMSFSFATGNPDRQGLSGANQKCF